MPKSKITCRAGKDRLDQLESLRATLSAGNTYLQGDSIALIEVGGLRPIRLNPVEVVVCEGDIAKIVETVAQVCGFGAFFGGEPIKAMWRSAAVNLVSLEGGGVLLIQASTRRTTAGGEISHQLCKIQEQIRIVSTESTAAAVREVGQIVAPLQTEIRAVRAECTETREISQSSLELTKISNDSLTSLKKSIECVKTESIELRHQVKERLEQMKAQGLFQFANNIDAESFKIFCSVLINNGNIAKASRELGIADSTLRSRMDKWKERGRAYQALEPILKSAKGKKLMGRTPNWLNDRLENKPSTNFPELLSDILDEILTLDPDNCSTKVEEIAKLMRPYVSRTPSWVNDQKNHWENTPDDPE